MKEGIEVINLVCQIIIAGGTLTAAGFAIYLYRKNSENENIKFWNENLPILILGSPCDVNQYSCDIDLNGETDNDEGNALFSIGNFTRSIAYDLTVDFSASEDFVQVDRSIYFNDIVTQYDSSPLYYIYSKYHIDPISKETKYDEYNII